MLRPHWLVPSEPYKNYDEYLSEYEDCSPLLKARDMGGSQVIKELKKAGLRGRGGAGFPTWQKWNALRNHSCLNRSVVCNAAEGEPGTFKDRFMIQRNPYALLEGLLIAAKVVETNIVRIGIKKSFRLEIQRLKSAIGEMRAKGFFQGMDLEIIEGPEEYLFGEEKGLLNVIDGIGPFPREAHYPPYEWGLGPSIQSPNPALVSNAETFAHVPSILHYGADSFRKIGLPETPGTVLVTVCGDVQNPGVFEVDTSTTLHEVFYGPAGGPRPGRRFKAVLSGVSAPVLLPGQFETPLGFDALREAGSSLGSAGFIVLDDTASIPRVAQAVARFLYVESCGQCPACKMGLRITSRSVDKMFDRPRRRPMTETKEKDLEEVAVEAALSGPQANRCFLPVGGSLAIPSLIRAFRGEFDELVSGHPAPGYPIPKIMDYDETNHVFTYDKRQQTKRPDWSYPSPLEAGEKPAWDRHDPSETEAAPCDCLVSGKAGQPALVVEKG